MAEVGSGEIRQLQALEGRINSRRSERLGFQVGDRVSVVDGAFCGAKAMVYELSDSSRVTLLLDFLGRKSRVQLDSDQLAAVA